MPDPESHLIHVRDKPGFLHRMMMELAGGDARISFEGDLSRCRFPDDLVVSREPVGLLRRNTSHPLQQFVVLRLTPEAVAPIFQQAVAAGLTRAVLHVYIERDGALPFGAHDNFHPECVGTAPPITATLLSELKDKGVVRDFRPYAPAGT